MFGVVLWYSSADQKAVIWCEDHGDLAFFDHSDEFNRNGTAPSVAFEAGDLIAFDLSEDGQMRKVMNPRLVAEDRFPGIAENLQKAGAPKERPRFAKSPAARPQGKVIAFSRKRLEAQKEMRISA
jgi:hypothetical protein